MGGKSKKGSSAARKAVLIINTSIRCVASLLSIYYPTLENEIHSVEPGVATYLTAWKINTQKYLLLLISLSNRPNEHLKTGLLLYRYTSIIYLYIYL